jgi:hypothetical protein
MFFFFSSLFWTDCIRNDKHYEIYLIMTLQGNYNDYKLIYYKQKKKKEKKSYYTTAMLQIFIYIHIYAM